MSTGSSIEGDNGHSDVEKREGAQPNFVTLPSVMPDEWVQQIKRSLPSSWATLLGGSVLAALIAWGSAWSTAKMTIAGNNAGNAALEHEKVKLQGAAEAARKRSINYANLAVALRELSDNYLAYQVLVQNSSENGRLRQDDSALQRQADNVAKSVVKVRAASALRDSGQLKPDIEQSLREVVMTIKNGAADRKGVLEHRQVGARLADLATQAQEVSDAPVDF